MSLLVAFSGPIGSGKSTVSRQVALELGGIWSGFGNTVRAIAAERNIPNERKALQSLGADLVANSPDTFCRRVIASSDAKPSQDLIIDGVRHISIRNHLRALSPPRRFCLIYVDAAPDLRMSRLKTRDGLSADEVAELSKHSTEVEVETQLSQQADKKIQNFSDPAIAVDEVLEFLRSFRKMS